MKISSLVSRAIRVSESFRATKTLNMEGDFIKLAPSKPREPRRKRPRPAACDPQKEAQKQGRNARKVAVLGDKDSSVRLLEELVFGTEDKILDTLQEKAGLALRLDESDDEGKRSHDSEEEDGQKPIRRAAWIDEDDEIEEQVDVTHRFRQDYVKGAETSLSKTSLRQRMRNTFEKAMGGTPVWAQSHHKSHRRTRDEEEDSDEDDVTRSTGTFTRTSENLPKGILKMKKVRDANCSRSSEDCLTSVQFHPSAQVVMTTGIDQSLSLFQVDGETNPQVQSVFLERFPVHRAQFTPDGLSVMATSFKNKLFYLYHMTQGKVTPVSGVRGLNEARVKDFSMCPVGDTVLLYGTRGYLHLLTLKTNEVVQSLKMNGEVCGVAFSPEGNTLFSSSDEGEVYVWDLKTSRCLNRFTDDGCVKATAIATSPSGRHIACGSQSGVVNIYSVDSCLTSPRPSPLRSVMNLTTPVTSLTFNPTSDILALGSRAEDEAVRLLHVPSLSVFSNFPISKRKICFRTQDLAFSPNSGFFCSVNNKGRAPLYRLLHYKDF